MKPVLPVGAGKVNPIYATYFGPAFLSPHGIERKNGMVIDETSQNSIFADLVIGIQRYAIILFHRQRLQPVHVISHCDRTMAIAGIEMQKIIPGRSSRFSPGE